MAERELFLKLKEGLEAEKPLRELGLSDDERLRLRGYALLSEKPLLVVANLDEARTGDADAYLDSSGLTEFARRPGVALVAVSAPIEAEMAELDSEDARAFREDLGLSEPGLDRVIRTSYDLLGLISFLTSQAVFLRMQSSQSLPCASPPLPTGSLWTRYTEQV